MTDKMKEKEYRWDAADYQSHSEVQQKWAEELINTLKLKGDEFLLDIGCGDGKITAALSKHLEAGRVVGIDSSQEMIALAKEKYTNKSWPNLSFSLMDARKLTFENEFDIIFSNAALHWLLDHQPVLVGMYRSLKKNGRVLVQMGGKGNAKKVIAVFERIIADKPWSNYFKDFDFPYGFYGPVEYEKWLENVGFRIERIELVPKEMVHNSSEQFKGWVRTTWIPYLEKVPEEKRSELIDLLTGNYLESTGQHVDGKVVTSMIRLEFAAYKN